MEKIIPPNFGADLKTLEPFEGEPTPFLTLEHVTYDGDTRPDVRRGLMSQEDRMTRKVQATRKK